MSTALFRRFRNLKIIITMTSPARVVGLAELFMKKRKQFCGYNCGRAFTCRFLDVRHVPCSIWLLNCCTRVTVAAAHSAAVGLFCSAFANSLVTASSDALALDTHGTVRVSIAAGCSIRDSHFSVTMKFEIFVIPASNSTLIAV